MMRTFGLLFNTVFASVQAGPYVPDGIAYKEAHYIPPALDHVLTGSLCFSWVGLNRSSI